MLRTYILLYPIFCLAGAGLEWCFGALWNFTSFTPWVYPDSPLTYTSLEGIPLWGFGGLFCVATYLAITKKDPKQLFAVGISLVLAISWILFYSIVIQ